MQVTIIANGFQEDYIHNLVRALSFRMDKIEVIGSDIYRLDKFPSNVHFLNLRGDHDDHVGFLTKSIRILRYYYKLLKYLIRSHSSVVHVQWLRFDIVEGVFFALFIKFLGKKVVYTAHNILPHNKNGWYDRFKFKVIYSVQDVIIVHTDYIKTKICDIFNISSTKIHTVPHGVYEPLMNSSVDQVISRQKLDLPTDKIIILFFGRFSAYKGFDLIVNAVNRLKYQNEIFVLVAGRVADYYQKEFETLRSECDPLKFRFILKHVSDEEMEFCFKASNFCIIPYKEASQSGVLFMSYAYGTPVIVSRIGGFPEDTIHGKTGYLFDAADPTSLAKTIDQAIASNNSSELLSRDELKSFAVDNYSWDIAATSLVGIYKKF